MENLNRKRKAEDDLKSLEDAEKTDQSAPKEEATVSVTSSNETAAPTSGFAAYAKSNPFQAAAAGIKPSFGSGLGGGGFGATTTTKTVFGSGTGGFGTFGSGTGGFGAFGSSFGAATSTSNSASVPSSSVISPSSIPAPPAIATPNTSSAHSNTTGLTINASFPSTRPNFTMPPPLVVPSPKSPKMNPFSSPSPAHNPFMTIVDSKDELWKTMAKDKLTEEDIVKSNNLQFSRSTSSSKRQRTFGSSSNNSDNGYASEEAATHSAEKSKQERSKEEEDDADEAKNNDNKAKESTDKNDENEDDNDQADANNVTNNDEESTFVPTKIYALPENVTVVTGEENDECLLQTRAKLYRLSVRTSHNTDNSSSKAVDANDMEWIEVGVGPLKILQRVKEVDASSQEAAVNEQKQEEAGQQKYQGRLVMRREDKKGGIGTKLLINTRLNQYVTVARQGDKMVRMLCVNYADDTVVAAAPAAPATSSTVPHALLSGLTESSGNSNSSSTSSATVTAHGHTAALHTYLLKMRDAKDCEEIIRLVGRFAAHEEGNKPGDDTK